jgi:hypothetical protein
MSSRSSPAQNYSSEYGDDRFVKLKMHSRYGAAQCEHASKFVTAIVVPSADLAETGSQLSSSLTHYKTRCGELETRNMELERRNQIALQGEGVEWKLVAKNAQLSLEELEGALASEMLKRAEASSFADCRPPLFTNSSAEIGSCGRRKMRWQPPWRNATNWIGSCVKLCLRLAACGRCF